MGTRHPGSRAREGHQPHALAPQARRRRPCGQERGGTRPISVRTPLGHLALARTRWLPAPQGHPPTRGRRSASRHAATGIGTHGGSTAGARPRRGSHGPRHGQ
ncbi:MAG: hypothetical protein CSB44_09530, partial [Gammaproteobacteria bacterium]